MTTPAQPLRNPGTPFIAIPENDTASKHPAEKWSGHIPEDLELRLVGNMNDGGWVVCRFEDRKGTGVLSPCVFAVLTVLGELTANCHAEDLAINFVSASRLAHLLSRRSGFIEPDKAKLAKYIHRARTELVSIIRGHRKLRRRLIRSRRHLGYLLPAKHVVIQWTVEPNQDTRAPEYGSENRIRQQNL